MVTTCELCTKFYLGPGVIWVLKWIKVNEIQTHNIVHHQNLFKDSKHMRRFILAQVRQSLKWIKVNETHTHTHTHSLTHTHTHTQSNTCVTGLYIKLYQNLSKVFLKDIHESLIRLLCNVTFEINGGGELIRARSFNMVICKNLFSPKVMNEF